MDKETKFFTTSQPESGSGSWFGPHKEMPIHTPKAEPSLTLRDYFAARAPQSIAYWFKPVMPYEKPAIDASSKYYFTDPTEQELIRKYYDTDAGYWIDDNNIVPESLKKAVEEHEAKRTAQYEKVKEWEEEYKKQEYFQWRYYYADQMIQFR